MLPDPKKLSEIIRAKKKSMMEADPELVDTDSKPDMNPMDAYNLKNQARIESTLDTPHKINAQDAEVSEDDNIGLSDEEKMRMERLRKRMDLQDIY